MAKAEVELINAIVSLKDIDTVMEHGADQMFNTHREVWEFIVGHYQHYHKVPDFDIVKEKYPDLIEMKTNESMLYYIDRMRDYYIEDNMREVITAQRKVIAKDGAAKALDNIIAKLNTLARSTGVVKDLNVLDYEDAIEDFKERQRRVEKDGGLGIMTGIKPFDLAYPTGLAPGHFISIIAWSSHGKTSFATYLACQAWLQGKKPMIVSMEMSSEEMRDKIYTTLGSGQFSQRGFTRGDIDIDTFAKWGKNKLRNSKDFIIVSSEGFDNVTLNTVQAKVEQYEPDIVILDYLQLFDDHDNGGMETVKVRNISKQSKRLAIRNNIPVVGLTQATQDNKSDLNEPPLIEQVAWSKGIQHDSNLAIAVHMPPGQTLPAQMEVIARKNRHGGLFGFYIDVDMENGVWDVHFGADDAEEL